MPQAVPFLIAAAKVIGTAIVNAAIAWGVTELMGLNDPPKPEAGKAPLKQTIPPEQVGYGRCRVSGPYLLWETVNGYALDVIALLKGPIDGFEKYYLNDDEVTLLAGGVVAVGADGRYRRTNEQSLRIFSRVGAAVSTPYAEIIPISAGTYTAAHYAHGVATMAIIMKSVNKPELIPKLFPNGPVQGSAVVRASKVYDWRLDSTRGGSGSHRLDDPSTWAWSENPVVCLLHDEVHSRGQDFDYRFAPSLDYWTVAANICEELVPLAAGGTVKRYTMGGWYRSNNAPKEIRGRFLQCFDGLMIERGDGAFVVHAGKWVEPTTILNADRIRQYTWTRTRRREDAVNKLVLSYTSPTHDWAQIDTTPWEDAASIAAIGEQTQPFECPWVTVNSQVRRLGKAVFSRLVAEYRGTFVIDLSDDEQELEERFYRIQLPNGPSSLANVPVEISSVTLDLENRLVTVEVSSADPTAWDWNAAAEEGPAPVLAPVPPPNPIPVPITGGGGVIHNGGTPRLDMLLVNPGISDFSVVLGYTDPTGAEVRMELVPVADGADYRIRSGPLPSGEDIEYQLSYRTARGDGDFSTPVGEGTANPGAQRPIGRSIDFPTSSDDSSITITAFDAYLADGSTVAIPSGSVSGLTSGLSYGIFWRPDLGFEAEVTPASTHMSTGGWIFVGWQTTSSGGVFPTPPPPPPGWGGDGQHSSEVAV